MVQHQYVLSQNRVESGETPSSDYQLMNVAANFKFGSLMGISAGVRNVFNEEYIDHLSRLKNIGMYHPGRNFFVQLAFNFNKQLNNKK